MLTLTATPIPRTLEMSLTGIRDLTLLNTPPAERQPILTYVGEYDERAVAEAIRRELLREGQVFFVHNRVQDIEQVAAEPARAGARGPHRRRPRPDGRGHASRQVVLDFWEGEFDVLVCTTIIESGIDMPTVNTLVVDRADLLGLGQLHQLRGRVGRAGQRAYAYLFFPPDRSLTEEAYERLKTIGEATELGSGFKIAMRDLEIRGAGNLLGTGQSGHIAAVGYDLYCQMVTEAVAELKGEPRRRAGRDQARAAPRRQPARPTTSSARSCASRPTAASPRSRTPGRGRRHPRRVGGPLRPGAAAGRGAARRWPGCGPSACAPASARSPSPRAPGSAAPSTSPASARSPCRRRKTIRLERLYKGSVYKAGSGPAAAAAEDRGRRGASDLVAALADLVPPAAGELGRCRRVDCHRPEAP